MKFSTKAIHSGQSADPATGSTVVPIYQTSTFTQSGISEHKGYEYSRSGNPTRTALEQNLSALENGKFGLSFASGMAAEHAILSCLDQGSHVVAFQDMYGGTYRLFEILSGKGISFSYIDQNPESFEKAVSDKTTLFWIESPTNPLLQIVDIESIAAISKKHNITLVVDNTFATPYFQKPLDLGADIVIHSTTKYLGGHSDVIGGAAITNSSEWYEKIKFYQNAFGGVSGPFDCWLTLRGIKTLALRMQKHEENALKVAELLSANKNVNEVFYPGLITHPNHDIAKRQMSGFGGMVSFKIKGGFDEANHFMKRLKIFSIAESLGGVESLCNYSARMTHASIPLEVRQKIGVTDDLIRLSVGIEDSDDLIEDLNQALK
jgi:cystathionine gamma-lyase